MTTVSPEEREPFIRRVRKRGRTTAFSLDKLIFCSLLLDIPLMRRSGAVRGSSATNRWYTSIAY